MTAEQVTPDGEAEACALLGEAFATDPFVSWMYPDARTRRVRFARLMTRLVGITRPYHRLLRTTDRPGAAALWIPPGRAALGRTDSLRMIPELPRMGLRTPRILLTLDHLDRHHPTEPHWYLFVVGSHPGERGRGHGRAVIQPPLDEADAQGMPCYLESSNPANVPYYERFGFRVTGELRKAGSPPMIPMWRDPH